jgi:hypothetical protein
MDLGWRGRTFPVYYLYFDVGLPEFVGQRIGKEADGCLAVVDGEGNSRVGKASQQPY